MNRVSRLIQFCVLTLLVVALSSELSAQTLTVSATAFDSVACGTKKCQNVVFKNNTGAPQVLESIGVLGSTFTLEDPNYTPPYNMKAGDSVSLLFCFNAGSPTGPTSDTILVQLTGVATQQRVGLSGVSVSPRMVVSQSALDFGVIIVGTAKEITVVVTNQGDGTLTVPNASGVAPPYYVVKGAGAIIPPGQSDTLSFLYVPTTDGTNTATAVFGNPPCLANVSVRLNGVAVKAPIPTIGGVLQVNPSVVSFDTALCGQRKTMRVQFLNVGSDTVIVRSVANPPTTPFSGTVPLGRIAPLRDTTFDLFYTPTTVPSVDSQTVRIMADTRQSLSIGMLFDVSGSMSGRISNLDATVRLRAAQDAGKIFLSQLINDPSRNVVDQAQIMSFSAPASTFKVQSAFTTNRGLSAFAIDGLVASGSTCLYESIRRAVDSIKTRPRPVLVILSDGGNSGCDVSSTLADAIAAISANSIRTYVVGINDPADPLASILQQIAAAGNGTASFARTQEELTNAFIAISKQLSQNILVDIPVRGLSVAPLLTLNPSVISFDSVKIGNSACLNVSVTNTGTAAQTLNPTLFSGLDPQFEIQNLPVAALQPGAAPANFQLCFRPTALRVQRSPLNVNYNSCRPALQVNAVGIGYDSVIVVLDTIHTNARIGDTVRIPLLLRSLIPSTYLVDSLSFTLSYNSTVLALQSTPTAGTLTSVYTAPQLSNRFLNLSGMSSLRYTGGTLQNTVANSRLGVFDFMVLRGNAMESTVRLDSIKFADGNPKVGIIQPARVQLDPTCFLTQRLIDPSRRIGQIVFLSYKGNDGSGRAVVRYRVDQECSVRLVAYDQLGRQLGENVELSVAKGEHESAIDYGMVHHAPVFLRIEGNGSVDSMLFQAP